MANRLDKLEEGYWDSSLKSTFNKLIQEQGILSFLTIIA